MNPEIVAKGIFSTLEKVMKELSSHVIWTNNWNKTKWLVLIIRRILNEWEIRIWSKKKRKEKRFIGKRISSKIRSAIFDVFFYIIVIFFDKSLQKTSFFLFLDYMNKTKLTSLRVISEYHIHFFYTQEVLGFFLGLGRI